MPHPNTLRRADSVLVVVDMQEPFLRGIADRERLLLHVRLLIQSAALLQIPILASLQYASRMGGFVEEIREILPKETPMLDKLTFSCAGDGKFLDALQQTKRRQILICGVETHICVAQTAMDLTAEKYDVQVAPDAVSSRTLEKHKLGMERIRDCGILPVAAEAAVYEWLGKAGTPEFKQILTWVK